MASHQNVQSTSPSDVNNWAGQEFHSGSSHAGNLSPVSPTSPSVVGTGYLKDFGGVQKKVTREGQPPKRRGPKPDSKPAQTRRQELNRQAQRTHRERKEQYIKALEIEMSRLRENYARETVAMKTTLERHRDALIESQTENTVLRDILSSRGIAFQSELDTMKSAMIMQSRNDSFAQPSPGSVSGGYGQISPQAFSSSGRSPPLAAGQKYSNGPLSSGASVPTMGHTYHGHSSEGPAISEQAFRQESSGIPDMPGVFERDQQLGIDFILSLEATCRDHGEYLVRRSVDSPDNPEEAQFSGHALMACCPPPSHISTVPAQQGGLQPTYPHQVPDVPTDTLNILLNLSQQIAGQGHIEGGQVTPIMALQQLKAHPHYSSLTAEDVRSMIGSFRKKVRCYGFGAVMEDFELRDGLHAIFASKYGYYDLAHDSDEQLQADDL